jgi:S-adenosylmethionine hydrolase
LRIISLTTDFGLKDPYVAQIKAVLLGICPNAVIVDITHEVEKYNIMVGAFIIASTIKFFPKGSIHIGVIDPGVGGSRKPIVVETKRNILVGPDNGLLIPAAKQEGIKHVFELTNKRYIGKKISKTFHGRDFFAPIAGNIANGVQLSIIGKEIIDYNKIVYPRPEINGKYMNAIILYVDSFGNIITNLNENNLELFKGADKVKIYIRNKPFKITYKETYEKAESNKLAFILGSQGFLEIALKEGNAAKLLGLKIGEKLKIKFKD